MCVCVCVCVNKHTNQLSDIVGDVHLHARDNHSVAGKAGRPGRLIRKQKHVCFLYLLL